MFAGTVVPRVPYTSFQDWETIIINIRIQKVPGCTSSAPVACMSSICTVIIIDAMRSIKRGKTRICRKANWKLSRLPCTFALSPLAFDRQLHNRQGGPILHHYSLDGPRFYKEQLQS